MAWQATGTPQPNFHVPCLLSVRCASMLQSSRLPDPRLSVFWRDRLFFVQNRMRSARVTAASFLRRTDENTRLSVFLVFSSQFVISDGGIFHEAMHGFGGCDLLCLMLSAQQ